MVAITMIRFRDIEQREIDEQNRLANRLGQFSTMVKNGKNLATDEQVERKRIDDILHAIADDPTELCDPLFVGVRDLFNASPGILNATLENHDHGVLKASVVRAGSGSFATEAVTRVALTFGLMSIDGVLAPQVMTIPPYPAQPVPPYIDGGLALQVMTVPAHPAQPAPPGLTATATASSANHHIESDATAPEYGDLGPGFYTAIGQAKSMHDLAMLVLPLLAEEGDANGKSKDAIVDTTEFAKVMRALHARGVTGKDQLRRRINEELDRIQFVGIDKPVTEMGIDLPDLEQASDADIVPDNVRLMGPMVCAAMFDELKAFQVVDKLVELFQHGMLAIGSGDAGKLLYRYWKDAPNRMSEGERKNFYSMTMGIPGGESSGMVNRDFNDLWLRFVSSVSSFIRQNEVDKLLRAALPSPISQQQVRKAARDLATNLSLHGYGMAYYAALDLQDQIRFMIKLLSDKDIRSAYGARDMWQVVDQVATLELGGAKTSSRYRTLATCGAIITAWLANNVQRIMRPTSQIIDIDDVRSPIPRSNGSKATTNPSDYDLVNACELWLADTATSDTRVDEMAQPREAPVMTSKPVQIPQMARDMLDGLPGVGMGLGAAPMGSGNGYAGARH